MRTVKFGNKDYELAGTQPIIGNEVVLVGAKEGKFTQTKPERKNKYMVLGTFPSADTAVCDMQILKMAELSHKYKNVDFVTFSMDLPTALSNYSEDHEVGKVQLYSDYLDHEVARGLGVLIEELQLCARSLFILDDLNKVQYVQINEKTGEQVDFKSMQARLDELLGENNG
ncbi:redoxin domain-containing protein [Mycoplasmopsis verecunda]|uniref:Thiol peroxidase, atypical 2-Cys peroxiredoxin n=1 Tax=Mycoplasmopsis verecunda TaxID=171291 RepID=A0A1T4M1S7_9BACT|nr:redoxin domain-containing protein [Mycoplasmopsis verecunda]WPB54745.1 redoxin domain-containing protein [Mycoplasmopsis verecunda]SJZ60728.1 thiol peroxidase, atypical 2-Cys peroxiredoxin [Mycoplasmopsis verecunda]